MEIRTFCLALLQSPTLEGKLSAPTETLTDRDPGSPLRIAEPARCPKLEIVPASKARVPGLEGMRDPQQRGRILHSMANHELQAAELFAWALLLFSDAPAEFRSGLLRILREEQMHCKLYQKRLEEAGLALGDYPVSGYFWHKMEAITTPSQFLCAMSLTFENANLDHTLDYAKAARSVGDKATALLLDRIHRDEIGHVKFGWEWLTRFKALDQTMVDAYQQNLQWPLRPALAKGRSFHREGREAAGLDDAFIDMIEGSEK